MTDQADPDGILATLAAEHNEVERALADPAVHADQARARTLGRR
jgi:peptide chain release factor 1